MTSNMDKLLFDFPDQSTVEKNPNFFLNHKIKEVALERNKTQLLNKLTCT